MIICGIKYTKWLVENALIVITNLSNRDRTCVHAGFEFLEGSKNKKKKLKKSK